MKVKELINDLQQCDEDADVIVVVYTEKEYEAGYIERIDPNVKYNSITREKLDDGEKVVEITTTTKV